MVKLISPKCGSVVRTQTDVQREFIKRIAEDGTEAAIEWLLPLKAGKEQSYPMSLVLSWEGDGSRSYEVVLSERDDIADGFTYVTEEEKLAVFQLDRSVRCRYGDLDSLIPGVSVILRKTDE